MIKQRNIGICILLSIVTCGIYGLYWFVVLTDDINQESGETDATSGGMSLLLTIVTCNIYGWFWAYKMGEKVDIIKMSTESLTWAIKTFQPLQKLIELLHMRLCRTLQTNMQRLYLR